MELFIFKENISNTCLIEKGSFALNKNLEKRYEKQFLKNCKITFQIMISSKKLIFKLKKIG